MRKIFFLLFAVLICTQLNARKKLLDDLDFTEGQWVMVGVSLHNYHMLPLQEQIGTFIMKDMGVLKQIQRKWEFEEAFEDYCDYHYALKFYKDGELQKTLKVNLLCDYISQGGLSYNFDERIFTEFKRHYKKIRWSSIRFRDLDLLKVSIHKLEELPGVYWYGDVKQYNFKGSFSISIDQLRWNANKDSVMAVLTNQLRKEMGREDFYVTLKYWRVSEDLEWMDLRLNVFCNEEFYKRYTRDNVITRWRDHFSEQSFVQIVVIGLNQEDYFRAMNY